MKQTSNYYTLMVWSKGRYVGWGVFYTDRDKCINHLKEYLQQCKNIYNRYKDFGGADEYKRQYDDYTSHPVKLIIETYVTETTEREEEIDING